jgi:uncharacterized Tic20 family protein
LSCPFDFAFRCFFWGVQEVRFRWLDTTCCCWLNFHVDFTLYSSGQVPVLLMFIPWYFVCQSLGGWIITLNIVYIHMICMYVCIFIYVYTYDFISVLAARKFWQKFCRNNFKI